MYENQWQPIDTYRLRISQPRFKLSHLHYEDNTPYNFKADPMMPNQFLFGLHFEKSYLVSAPGDDVSFWANLCIFSYFMIHMKSYDLFDSFLEQFNIAIQNRGTGILRENLVAFFCLCRKYYGIIEDPVKQDMFALKIITRMTALLPINRENMTVGSEAAKLFASIVLKHLSERSQEIWTTVIDSEWLSFSEGLVKLCCIQLLDGQVSIEQTNDYFIILSTIPDKTRREETVIKLLTLLNNLRYTLPRNQDVALYSLIDQNHLTLEHIELAASLETYISYLTQFVLSHQEDPNELHEKIQTQLDKLLSEKRFLNELDSIVYLLKFMATQTTKAVDDINEAATKRVKFVFETSNAVRKTVENYLNERNVHITLDEFPLIRDIIFRYHSSYILHNIACQQYLGRMLHRRDNQTANYFIIWFQQFLCESNPDWMNYETLLIQWTQCFVHNQDLFSTIIQQIDTLIELWTKVAPNDHKRTTLFVTHMITECFRQGKEQNI
ncbi:unnamed protein product [Adineta steineri]|uniref:Uncharacterized protein n=1 Tax=Adineta steineri TaxID=433720 RepID=A0A815GLC9_9BILA|nr:unnamed protein product [Adineta steineri]